MNYIQRRLSPPRLARLQSTIHVTYNLERTRLARQHAVQTPRGQEIPGRNIAQTEALATAMI